MAGDWIKVEKATLEKPEVLAISEMLGIHPVHAFGLCVKFWMWCDDQLSNGNAKSVTKVTLDYVIGHDGMTDALLKVDWLRDRSGSLEVPHFDRHLSEGAKNRALTKERVRKSKGKSNAKDVTKVTQRALPEKRREDIVIYPQTRAHEIPDLTAVQHYASNAPIPITEECAVGFFDTQQAAGWVDRHGRSIADWRAALRRYASHWNENDRIKAMKGKANGTDHRQQKAAAEFREPDITEKIPSL